MDKKYKITHTLSTCKPDKRYMVLSYHTFDGMCMYEGGDTLDDAVEVISKNIEEDGPCGDTYQIYDRVDGTYMDIDIEDTNT